MKEIKIVFSNLLAIYRRELQSYFRTPWAYAIAGIYWLIVGVLFVNVVLTLIGSVAMADQAGSPPQVDLAYEVVRSYFGTIGPMSLFIFPFVDNEIVKYF